MLRTLPCTLPGMGRRVATEAEVLLVHVLESGAGALRAIGASLQRTADTFAEAASWARDRWMTEEKPEEKTDGTPKRVQIQKLKKL